jgi:hypothetical protein
VFGGPVTERATSEIPNPILKASSLATGKKHRTVRTFAVRGRSFRFAIQPTARLVEGQKSTARKTARHPLLSRWMMCFLESILSFFPTAHMQTVRNLISHAAHFS